MRTVGAAEFRESEDRLTLRNAALVVEVSKTSGAWLTLATAEHQLINHRSPPVVPVDFKIDGAWQVELQGCRYLGFETEQVEGGTALHVRLGVGTLPASFSVPENLLTQASQDRDEYELTCTYLLADGETSLRLRATVKRLQDVNFSGVRNFRFESFLFKLPGVIIGEAGACTVDMPGPVVAWDILKPRLSYTEAKTRFFNRRTAPDYDPGIVVINNESAGLTLSTWIETLETCYSSSIAGNGKGVTVAHTEEFASYILDAATLTSHDCVIRVSDAGIPEALRTYAAYITQVAPPMSGVPAWVKDAVFMEVDTRYYGGFSDLQDALPKLADVGFNALYLMPIHEGGYLVSDHYSITSDLGSVDDLKAMVREAHRLGIRVLLDLLITILKRDSALVREHPEYFQRDETGRICPHFKWDNAATDPAHPGFRRYIVDFATYCVREYGVDGFRVDAASANTPNWYPLSGREPRETMMGSYKLMAEVNAGIKAVNPEAILLDELGGPIFFHVSDICHNFGFVHQLFWDEIKAQGYTVRSYRHLLADMQDLMPDAALRVFYTRNHDAAWFTRFEGYTPEFFAYEAIHCLIKGIPLMFSGQERWPGPTDEDFAFYKRLLDVRRQYRVLTEGECLYHVVDVDDDRVFSVIRKLGEETVLCLVSAAGEQLHLQVTVSNPNVLTADGPTTFAELLSDRSLTVDRGDQFSVDLEPYAIRVYRF